MLLILFCGYSNDLLTFQSFSIDSYCNVPCYYYKRTIKLKWIKLLPRFINTERYVSHLPIKLASSN